MAYFKDITFVFPLPVAILITILIHFSIKCYIVDYFIDVTGSFKKIGKTPGKDIKQGKSTLSKLIGRDEALDLCNKKINFFKNKYKLYLRSNEILIEILNYGLKRIN